MWKSNIDFGERRNRIRSAVDHDFQVRFHLEPINMVRFECDFAFDLVPCCFPDCALMVNRTCQNTSTVRQRDQRPLHTFAINHGREGLHNSIERAVLEDGRGS